jgi:transcriptional regulator with XRE-family HTH domain
VSQPLNDFGSWLSTRITEAGYRSPSAFAAAAGLQPSVVHRWINGKVKPTPEALVKAAGLLPVRATEMLARGLGLPELEESTVLHPLAVRVNRLLTDRDLVPDDERHMLETILDRVLSPPEQKYYRIASIRFEQPAE